MDAALFAQVVPTFAAFHQRFAPLFGRKEAQQRSEQYLRGLLVQQTDRRNAENVAEAIDGATARSLQRLLTEAPWPVDPVIDALQVFLAERLAAPDGLGVFVLDDTGFPKQGTQSVGVARQYSGTLGKVGNCQIGVFLAYVSSRGHALVDRRLYLPRVWTDDPARCRRAGVPADVAYQSKAALGLAMLRQARAAGHLPGRWVTADEAFGQVPTLRDALDGDGWWYVLEVPAATRVFAQPAATVVPTGTGRGRPPTRPRLAVGAPAAQPVADLATALPAAAWQEVTVAEGAQGPRTYQFAAHHGWECQEGIPGRETWVLLRRNVDGSELKYYLSNAPAQTPLVTMAWVSAMRWPIETDFATYKGQTGLDEYEVRSWPGWHHHITLALLAGAFLLHLEQDWGEQAAAGDPGAGQPGRAGAAPPPDLDDRGPVGVAGGHRAAQRPRQTLPRQAPRPSAA